MKDQWFGPEVSPQNQALLIDSTIAVAKDLLIDVDAGGALAKPPTVCEAVMFARVIVKLQSQLADALQVIEHTLTADGRNAEIAIATKTISDLLDYRIRWQPVIDAAIAHQESESGPEHPEYCDGSCGSCETEANLYQALTEARSP